MKVISEGKRRPEIWEGMWECLTCKRIVELEQGDEELVVEVRDEQMEGTSLTLDCAICGKETAWHRYRPPVKPYTGTIYPENARRPEMESDKT